MEHRKNCDCQTPRERISDEMLLRMLDEEEPSVNFYGSARRIEQNHDRRSYCGRTNTVEAKRCNEARNNCIGCTGESRRNLESRPICTREQRPEPRMESCAENCAANHYLTGYPLAMAYVPDQEWRDIYEDEEGLDRGTIFHELDLPFYPTRCNESCRQTNSSR